MGAGEGASQFLWSSIQELVDHSRASPLVYFVLQSSGFLTGPECSATRRPVLFHKCGILSSLERIGVHYLFWGIQTAGLYSASGIKRLCRHPYRDLDSELVVN